jgi:hypothetical protein
MKGHIKRAMGMLITWKSFGALFFILISFVGKRLNQGRPKRVSLYFVLITNSTKLCKYDNILYTYQIQILAYT